MPRTFHQRIAGRSSRRLTAAIACAALIGSGCGGASKDDPAPEDVDVVAAAVADIVYQCGSYTAGHIAAPDTDALERDVSALLDAYERLEPDTSFEIGAAAGIPRTTSLRQELRFGARILHDGCVPEQAQLLTEAAAD